MTDPKTLSIQNYTYTLPEERIAHYPLAERDGSQLLIYEKGKIREDLYRQLADHIPANSVMIFNNTKVIAARLVFTKPTGGSIEIFCLEPVGPSPGRAMQEKERVRWKCLIGGASKWKQGQSLEKKLTRGHTEFILRADYIEKGAGYFIVELNWTPTHLSFAEVLHLAGAIPLPPYIKREAEEKDAERYQTIYADKAGSVAAPTAGLHFTQNIFNELDLKHISRDHVTLHVGAGTFQPVKSRTMQGHEMHAEFFEVSKTVIENIAANLEKQIIAVGTTSLRTLESLYWLGVKHLIGSQQSAVSNGQFTVCNLSQWEAYELEKYNIPVKEALQTLAGWMEKNKMEKLVARTQILIAPGYSFKIVKGLVTNFHQPHSTLLLLVAAFVGDDWRKVYAYALAHNFRFLSYGDGCLLWRR